MLQRQLDVDILVTGHTHQFTAYKHEGGVVINPGSATGAYSNITYDVNPSFVLMDIDGLRVVVYVYELIDGEVKVDKIDFKKTTAATHSAHWICSLQVFFFLFFSWYCIWIPWNEMWSTICAYLSGESLWFIYELWQFRTINEIYSLWIMIYWERRKLMTNHGPAFEFNTIFLSQVVMVLFWLICSVFCVIFLWFLVCCKASTGKNS